MTENVEAVESTEEGLSPNAEKVQDLADTLAAEIEAEGIAAPEDEDADDSKNDEDDDV